MAARWERVASFAGHGDKRSAMFSIVDHAIQWRVTAICTSGHLRVSLEGEPAPLAEPTCAGRAFGFSIREGTAALDVAASDAWEIIIDQQVDTPASEPVLPGMTDGTLVADGAFYGVEQEGSGNATLYRLPDGRQALRLAPFFVTPNTDLYVWLSEAESPKTSAEALHSEHVEIAELTATAGPQNYLLPDSVDTRLVRSVVIWCEPVLTAYGAAALASP